MISDYILSSLLIISCFFIVFCIINLIYNLYKTKKNKKHENDEHYTVTIISSDKITFTLVLIVTIILFLIAFIDMSDNMKENYIYLILLSPLYIIAIIVYFDTLSYKIEIEKDYFTIKKFLYKKKTYKFSDLTSYYIKKGYDEGVQIEEMFVFIDNKKIMKLEERSLNEEQYDKLKKTIKKHAKKIENRNKKSKTN